MPGDLAAAIRGHDDSVLSRRPDAKNWSAKEVVCHLRDIEELAIPRFHTVGANVDPSDPWVNHVSRLDGWDRRA